MKLHLLRHAETDSFSSSGKDIDRALLPEGIVQAERMFDYFKSTEGVKDVWCSNALRTRQTADIVLQSMGVTPLYEQDLHLASQQTILQKIWSHTGNEDLMIIGHNFGISDVATYFTDQRIDLGTAEYICIDFNCDSWEETSMGTGIIQSQYRP